MKQPGLFEILPESAGFLYRSYRLSLQRHNIILDDINNNHGKVNCKLLTNWIVRNRN